MSRSIFVMCDLVDWNGEPQSKLFPTCLQSPSQPAKSEVHWSDHEFIFRTDAGLDVAHFVRLQLFVEGSIMGRHLLGSAFVKPSEFRNDHSPIRVTLTPSLLPDAKFFEVDSQLLPYLQVICVRTEKHIDREPFQINLSGSIGPDITSEWVSEVVLAGDIYTAIYGEDCLMIDSFDALKLKCIHNAMARRRSSLKSASDVPEEVIVEVFENEQRTMIPPTDFSPENLIRHGHLTDESGTVVYSYDRLDLYPEPSGYEWCNEWCIDLWYTSCDFNGWSYATSFSNLREHLRKSDSISSSALKTVRRRRWTRSAKSLDMRHQLKESIAVEVPLHARDERQKQFVRSPDSILSVCKECKDVDSKIVSVPWNQVLSIVPLTPSTLCLTFNIHRYFGVDKTNHNAIYREVRVELFVLNCPAYWLSRQLDDHKSTLSSYHVEIGRAIIEEKQIMCASSLVESTSVLDTKELSPGCRVVFDIFEDIKLLKHSLDEIQQNFYLTGEESFQKSSQILQVRICRLELYIALVMDICMIPFSGSSIEYFSGERIKSILVQDFLGLKDIQTAYSKAAKPGSSINEVKLFENQLLYLEENADFRIRDAVLKGWLYQGGQLEHYLATIVNEHLVEMAALVGQYFEGIQVIKTLQVWYLIQLVDIL